MRDERTPPDRRDDGAVIFRRYRTDPRTGTTYDAHDYGLKAWPIRRSRKG